MGMGMGMGSLSIEDQTLKLRARIQSSPASLRDSSISSGHPSTEAASPSIALCCQTKSPSPAGERLG
ncbi:hypothetical protein DGN11_02000 [Xanthomonas citri pv. fuscans]|nr:hypothetical protein DGN11_02000 [Xanthomonas citri pv. fuscans]